VSTPRLRSFSMWCVCLTVLDAQAAIGSAADLVNISIGTAPDHEVRFTSGKTVYVEALVEDQWLGRYWNAGGESDLPGRQAAAPAFEIHLKKEPAAFTSKSVLKGWQWVSATESPTTDRGGRCLIVELTNKASSLAVKVCTTLDGTAVLARWLQITNTSRKPLALSVVAPWAGRLWRKDAPITLGCSALRTGQMAGTFAWQSLRPGVTTVESSGMPCYDDPYFILRNESEGEYFFGQLAWPTIYRMDFHRGEGLTFNIGPISVGGDLRVISPGETIVTPAVHLCHLKGDFDAAVQAMHEHVRRSVMPRRKPEFCYRIQYIANGDTGNCLYYGYADPTRARAADFTETNLRPCADVAAAVGAELFLIDGPFWAKREAWDRHDFNWLEASKEFFPRGMAAFSDYVHKKGLLFGAYARTEGCNMMRTGSRSMYEVVCAMIEKHKLDMYRHDTSENQWRNWAWSTVQDGFNECILWRHYETFFRDTDRIHEQYPNVVLQQADGGGGRSDLAVAGHWHEDFQSDLTAVPLPFQMMAGFSVFLPPEIMQSAYHGMSGKIPTDKLSLLRSIYALGNIPCIYWTLLPAKTSDVPPGELKLWRKYAMLYKTFIRPLLSTCKVYHHAPINAATSWDSGRWLVMEFIAPDRTKGWATIITWSDNRSETYLFRPKGLDAKKTYGVTFDNTSKRETFRGSQLMRDGFLIRSGGNRCSELLLFETLPSRESK
jgi:alpha-galactosidase